MNDQDFKEFFECLHSADVGLRSASLRSISARPTKDNRILIELENLLNDRSPCLVSIPMMFGEICWLAARALLQERAAQNINTIVQIPQVVRPLSVNELLDVAAAVGIESRKGGLAGSLEIFAQLRDADHLKRYDFKGDPAITRKYNS